MCKAALNVAMQITPGWLSRNASSASNWRQSEAMIFIPRDLLLRGSNPLGNPLPLSATVKIIDSFSGFKVMDTSPLEGGRMHT